MAPEQAGKTENPQTWTSKLRHDILPGQYEQSAGTVSGDFQDRLQDFFDDVGHQKDKTE